MLPENLMSFLSSDGNPRLAFLCLTRGVAASFLGLVCAAAPLSGVAQESMEDTDPALDLGTIMVTGQKSERSLTETDGSVTVVFPGDGEGVAGQAYDVFGVAERLANVMPFTAGSGVAIRGIGQTGFSSGPTFGQTNYLVTRGPSDLVATYVDGIPVSVYAGPLGDFWDVDQIEVLRGAQSTVLGRGSLGGAVVIESTDPTFTPELAGQLSAGTATGGMETSFAVSGPVLDDRFAYRVVFDRQRGPNFIENITLNQDGDQRKLLNRRVKFLYAGENGADLELSTFFSETTVGTLYVDAGSWPDRRVTQADVNTRLNNHITGASLRGSWPLSDVVSLESATVWVTENADQILDPDQTAESNVLTGVGIRRNDAQFKDDIRTVSQELRLRYTGERFRGFIGAYYEDFEGIAKTSSPVFGRKTIQQNISTAALFGEGKWSISEKMDLTLGLRAEAEQNRTAIDANINLLGETLVEQGRRLTILSTCRANPTPACANAPGPLAEMLTRPVDEKPDQDFSIFLPKLGLSYAVSPETRLYGSVQRGYRAGGAGASLVNAQLFEFDPETTWNGDLGIRHKSADGRLRLSANLFYVDWQDQQLQVPADGAIPDFISVNVGQSESYGSELEMDYQATQRLRLFTTVGLLKTQIKDTSNTQDLSANQQEEVQDWVGNSFTMAPEATISAGLHYDFDHGLDLSLAANWRDKFFSDIENRLAEEVDGRFLVDMGIGYEFADRDLRLDFKVANLFDTKYINHSYIRPVVALAERFNAATPLAPALLPGAEPPLHETDGIVAPGPGRSVLMSLTGRF
ncbi:MAG: hypothetical protein TE42_07015 [Candidatus Synechococcus spongiarum SP3]|uniref:TonB-dependent receptor n=1 Tax=Candidatus Synechococcus spongiarum SP3 TaxID=1604020 RepID=A0A0G2J4J8_9SYNE|nr:MAG: hypothetical protein TE42_07015 [Candidatus Synechococcus spongiarum SP3]